MTTTVAVVGASGKMGALACRIVEETEGFGLHAAIGSSGSLEEMVGADLVIDFTVPAVSQSVVDFAIAHGLSVIVGTSGWSADRIAGIERALGDDPQLGVIIVPNFSIGSVLGTSFATIAARFFDSIEIIESHHAGKVDSPSGTAVRTAELIGKARADLGPVIAPHVDQRARGQQVSSVPIHSLRMSGTIAKQEVVFGGTGEVLTVTHDTIASSSYESGLRIALRAARTTRGVVVGLGALTGLDTLIELGSTLGPSAAGE